MLAVGTPTFTPPLTSCAMATGPPPKNANTIKLETRRMVTPLTMTLRVPVHRRRERGLKKL